MEEFVQIDWKEKEVYVLNPSPLALSASSLSFSSSSPCWSPGCPSMSFFISNWSSWGLALGLIVLGFIPRAYTTQKGVQMIAGEAQLPKTWSQNSDEK